MSSVQQDRRSVGDPPGSSESLLRGSIQNFPGHGPYCIPCQHHLVNEDLISGVTPQGGMSAVRRFFCLFVTFDLLFTSLLWLICLVLAGNFDLDNAFESEIVHYTIETSLFDTVVAALIRFVLLQVFYALLHINHWSIVALTTSFSCAFLVAKVYMFTWDGAKQPVLVVLLILSSFIISWAEVWFLDLRVIPQERNAADYITATSSSERAPLLNKFMNSVSKADAFSEAGNTEFYSPNESPGDSDDDESRPRRKSKLAPHKLLQLRHQGEDLLEVAWSLLNHPDWSVVKTTKEGDKILSLSLPKSPRVFALHGHIDLPAMTLLHILYRRVEDMPSWNNTVKSVKILQTVDDFTDICHQVSGEIAGGAVSSRDFVLLRHWAHKYGHYIIASSSISACPCSPPVARGVIRGENGPGCWALSDQSSGSGCYVRWTVNTCVNGWVPQSLVDTATIGVMVSFIASLRAYGAQIKWPK